MMDGFEHCEGYFNLEKLRDVESVIRHLYVMQCNKIKDYRTTLDMLDALGQMEGKDKEALYQVQRFISASQEVRSIYDDKLMELCAGILGVDPRLMLLEGPGLFVSRPNTSRLLYKWHSEAHYYPKRRKFINLWFPIFTDRTEENGAMHLKPGSHKEHWDFAEYNSGPNTFVQYEIPEEHVALYPTHICESKRGDLIMFDRNLVHRSAENRSTEYAFAMVARAWCPVDDLTLSGNMAATPYGGDIGRAGLCVSRI